MAEGEKHIVIVAGEASGDLHGGSLARALRQRDPSVRLEGIGGDAMRASGVNILFDIRHLGVMGSIEVLSRWRPLRDAYRAAAAAIRSSSTRLAVLIDFPDFNLRLARVANRAGVPVVYYISPKIWAWRSGRIRTIRDRVKKMLVILPFEKAIYDAAGVECAFVGNPLLDEVNLSPDISGLRRTLGLADRRPVIALLPGSRMGEVDRILPVMLDAMNMLNERRSDAAFVLPVAPTVNEERIRSLIKASGLDVRLIKGRADTAIAASDCVLVASGTATLEAAILEKPMVIVYIASPVTFWLSRFLVHLRSMGLPNLLAGRRIVPELLQNEATAENMFAEVERILTDDDYREAMAKELGLVRAMLGTPGASSRAAEAVLQCL